MSGAAYLRGGIMGTVWAFFFTALLIEITPGPNSAYLAGLAMSRGHLAGLAATVGLTVALALVGILAVAGLAGLIAHSPDAYEALRWGGVAYLLWLAWQGWREADQPMNAKVIDRRTAVQLFGRGFLTNVLNPKSAVFYITVLPTFVDRHWQPVYVQHLVLVAIYVAVATGVHLGIVFSAAQAGQLLTTGSTQIMVRRALAVGLALVAMWFAWETRGRA